MLEWKRGFGFGFRCELCGRVGREMMVVLLLLHLLFRKRGRDGEWIDLARVRR